MPFQIVRGNITQITADAIVNTVNPFVEIGAGVETAIYDAAGREKLLAARKKIGRLSPGEAGVTPAFKLSAKYIIHSCCAPWEGGHNGEREFLHYCYEKALHIADAHHCKSVAFPLMATGFYGYPKEIGMEIAIKAFETFLKDHEMQITLVVFEDYAGTVSGEILDSVRTFVEDRFDNGRRTPKEPVCEASAIKVRTLDECGEDEGDEDERDEDERDGDELAEDGDADVEFVGIAPPVMRSPGRRSAKLGMAVPREASMEASMSSMSLDDRLKQMYTDSFEKHLQQLINKKHMKNSEVYAAANISKQYFSKLMKGQVKPSKEKVLSLAIGLRLNLDETIDFLRIAGYALSPVSQTDVIVEYFIRQGEYSVMKIDIVLFDYGLPLLSE